MVWGIVALICFDLLGIFSVQYVRMKSYNLFLGTHIVAFVVVLFAVGSSCSPPVASLTALYRRHATTDRLVFLTSLQVPLFTDWTT